MFAETQYEGVEPRGQGGREAERPAAGASGRFGGRQRPRGREGKGWRGGGVGVERWRGGGARQRGAGAARHVRYVLRPAAPRARQLGTGSRAVRGAAVRVAPQVGAQGRGLPIAATTGTRGARRSPASHLGRRPGAERAARGWRAPGRCPRSWAAQSGWCGAGPAGRRVVRGKEGFLETWHSSGARFRPGRRGPARPRPLARARPPRPSGSPAPGPGPARAALPGAAPAPRGPAETMRRGPAPGGAANQRGRPGSLKKEGPASAAVSWEGSLRPCKHSAGGGAPRAGRGGRSPRSP